MKIVAIMPCRNEDWIIGLSLRALMMWVDSAIVLDHCSTDRTREILGQIDAEYPGRLVILGELNPVWEEMRHRQRLLDRARQDGATHVIFIDADEVVTSNLLPQIRTLVQELGPNLVLELPWICLRGSTREYFNSGVWSEQFASCAAVAGPDLHWQSPAGEEHFHHRHPKGRILMPRRPIRHRTFGGLMHLQFADTRRLKAKQALYKMTEVLRWPGKEPLIVIDDRYNLAVNGGGGNIRVAQVPSAWWHSYEGLLQHMNIRAEPWQEAECRKLYAEHGPERFAGLDLFGVV